MRSMNVQGSIIALQLICNVAKHVKGSGRNGLVRKLLSQLGVGGLLSFSCLVSEFRLVAHPVLDRLHILSVRIWFV